MERTTAACWAGLEGQRIPGVARLAGWRGFGDDSRPGLSSEGLSGGLVAALMCRLCVPTPESCNLKGGRPFTGIGEGSIPFAGRRSLVFPRLGLPSSPCSEVKFPGPNNSLLGQNLKTVEQ